MHPLFRAIPSQFAKGCRRQPWRHLLLVLPVLALAASLGACALREPLQADNGEAAAPAGNAADETAPAPSSQADRSPQQREFHYDFVVPGHSRDELWHAATAYFSLGMGVNRPKFDKLDEDAGVMEGRGLEPWRLPGSGICFTRYALRFAADDGRVHLELEAFLGESEGPLDCAEWPILPRPSYAQMVADFNRTADELRTALAAGNGARGSRGY